jgi:branched-chain amino acid aminotransferase
MVNINGKLFPKEEAFISLFNTSIVTGDFIFENIIVSKENVFFYEDHYFNLLSSMRILKMKIPMSFTPEYLESQLRELYVNSGFISATKLMRIMISNSETNTVSIDLVNHYICTVGDVDYSNFNTEKHTLDVFKDYFKNLGLLSNLNTNNQLINRIGSRYCIENDFNDCVVLNNSKTISETLNGNIFLLVNDKILTPPLKDGCNNNVIRSKIIDIINNDIEGFSLIEQSLSVYDIQKSDELFISNITFGIQSIGKFRKKDFAVTVTNIIRNKLCLLVV